MEDNTAKRMTEVGQEFEQLDSIVRDLVEIPEIIERRFDSVLRQPPLEFSLDKEAAKEEVTLVPLATKINDVMVNLRTTLNQFNDILNRLEL